MAAVEYGTVAIVPSGEWKVDIQYDVGNLVSYNGSSYVVKIKPPAGTAPTDLNYWQVSAQGGNVATTEAVGVVKPDGSTITIDADGTIHGASNEDTATKEKAGIVKASDDIPVAEDGTMSVSTQFTQATELANIIAGEAIATVLGKVSKSIATTMNLDQGALLKNMLANNDVNDQNKIPTSAYIHTLYERIGMGTELKVGSNLTDAVNSLNSDLKNWELLWSNPSPAANFAQNTIIQLDLSGYWEILVVVQHAPSSAASACYQFVYPLHICDLAGSLGGVISTTTDNRMSHRTITITRQSINFGACYRVDSYGQSATGGITDRIIPRFVFAK